VWGRESGARKIVEGCHQALPPKGHAVGLSLREGHATRPRLRDGETEVRCRKP
jgi:hypothetical protein